MSNITAMIQQLFDLEARILALEKRLEGVDPSVCLVDKVKIQLSMTKDIRELKKQIAGLKENLKFDIKTEKKCADCRKYKTEDCPPWPTKGPDHWCTQYQKKASGGEKEGDKGQDSNLPSSVKLTDASKLPEPKPWMICGDGPEPKPKTEPEKEQIYTTIEQHNKAMNKQIEEFIEDISDWDDFYIYWRDKKEKWQGRIK